MEDRELLELAAKALGIDHPGGEHCVNGPALWDCKARKWWRPLTDDGDNRRLQVKLRLGLVPLEGRGWDCYSHTDAGENMLATDMDPSRAVVLAAAAIGKEM
ncbi:hypothetical protein [Achromobacter xylosoxidans]|uniref:hypothetical protein n=1 Tax=Alcaligenes xylosoxydans xylosoxydans TaxID=85698 RepID=UPI001F13EA0E|nr:hypothetical protein [Achromobacter xylosoxidans]